jgi:7-carboxy-7-deazaguanine synthase
MRCGAVLGRSGPRTADLAMTYSVKEIFYTLQGEGSHAGRPAVFCRFAGCNLWSGLERDRAAAVCNFCDTDFVGVDGQGGGKFQTANSLAQRIAENWPNGSTKYRFVVCTGGEPLLQLDSSLIDALHSHDFEIAVETNGTCEAPNGIDWICVSPKGKSDIVLKAGHELKLVYPQVDALPEQFEDLEFDRFYLQPMYGPSREGNTLAAIEYCKAHPQWRLGLQTHKILRIP